MSKDIGVALPNGRFLPDGRKTCPTERAGEVPPLG